MITKKQTKAIIIKLTVHMYHGIVNTFIQIPIRDITDDVIRS